MKRKRRERGSGTVRQRADGRWEGRLNRPGGKALIVYGHSHDEVVIKLSKLDVDRASTSAHADMTLGEWLDTWLEQKRGEWEYRTLDGHERRVAIIKEKLGDEKLVELRPFDIVQMLTDLRNAAEKRAKRCGKQARAKDGAADNRAAGSQASGSRSRQLMYTTLHAALQAASKQLDIANVCDRVDKPKHSPGEKLFIAIDQYSTFRNLCTPGTRNFIFAFLPETGLRQAEALALKWTDVFLDSPNPYVRVRAALKKKDRDSKYAPGTLKTKQSRRDVYLTKFTAASLRAHRQALIVQGRETSGFVFPRDDDSPMTKDQLWFRRGLLKAAGLDESIDALALRRTHATWLIAHGGVDPKTAAARLGHASTRMTMDIYAQVVPALQHKAVAGFHSALRRAISGQKSGQHAKGSRRPPRKTQ